VTGQRGYAWDMNGNRSTFAEVGPALSGGGASVTGAFVMPLGITFQVGPVDCIPQ
jgi:hypothetical protein